MKHETIILSRDVTAIRIPDGDALPLPAGSQVMIQQALGDTFTVVTETGYMARIAGFDADALGKENPRELNVDIDSSDPKAIEKAAWDLMRTCFDPEIPVNIVDLGLILSCEVVPDQTQETTQKTYQILVKMTLTAPGCGMGPVLQHDAQTKLSRLPGVSEATVNIVFDIPWHQGMMSDAARLQLGIM